MDSYSVVMLSKTGKEHIVKNSEDWITLCGRNDQKIGMGNRILFDANLCKICLKQLRMSERRII